MKKLSLKDLQVKSFITSLNEPEKNTIQGAAVIKTIYEESACQCPLPPTIDYNVTIEGTRCENTIWDNGPCNHW